MATAPPKPVGQLRIEPAIARQFGTWIVETVAEVKRSGQLGEKAQLSQFAAVTAERLKEVNETIGLAFKMDESFRLTLVDFIRRECSPPGRKESFLHVLAVGWAPAKRQDVPTVTKAEADAAHALVERQEREAEAARKRGRPAGTLI